MKKLLIIFLILPLIFFCGFRKKEKPYVILSAGKITKEKLKRVERSFNAGQRIYYTMIVPEGFKYSGIRMQISSKDEKTSNWGYTIRQTNDFYVNLSDNVYSNYFVLQRPGYYIIQFFYINNKRYPFIHKEFMVY